MGIRVAGDKEGEEDEAGDGVGDGFGGKSDGNKGSRQLTATRAMPSLLTAHQGFGLQ